MMKIPFEAIIFDLDGTLVDTESADFRACQMLYAEHGLPFSEAYWAKYVVGHVDGYELIFSELIRHQDNGLTPADLRCRLQEFWPITLESVELRPGVANLLSQLSQADYPLAVATASDRDWAERWLNQFNLWPYFRTVTTSENVVHNKPAPDVYLYTAAQLGVKPERCLVFEDSLPGLQSAKSAGMTVVVTPSHALNLLDFSQADLVLHSLLEFTPAWIETFKVTP